MSSLQGLQQAPAQVNRFYLVQGAVLFTLAAGGSDSVVYVGGCGHGVSVVGYLLVVIGL